MFRKLLLLIVALSLAVGFARYSMAAIIGPKDDWIPIEDATKPCPANPDPHLACGLSQEQVDSIMAAGMRFECPVADGLMLNAWALDDGTGDAERIYTNAHALIGLKSEKMLGDISECAVTPFFDISGAATNIDMNNVYLGSLSPTEDKSSQDRARIGILKSIDGIVPLKLRPRSAEEIRNTDKLYLISLMPPNMQQVVIQACYALRPPFLVKENTPRVMGTDCDIFSGNSSGLYMLPHFNSGKVARLEPIAIHRGSVDKIGDYREWDGKNNTGTAILLDARFSKSLTKFLPYN